MYMKKIIYTQHLKMRLEIRKFPKYYPMMIYMDPEIMFLDMIEMSNIAIKSLIYNGKHRNILIAYEEDDDCVNILTIHPITDKKIKNRI